MRNNNTHPWATFQGISAQGICPVTRPQSPEFKFVWSPALRNATEYKNGKKGKEKQSQPPLQNVEKQRSYTSLCFQHFTEIWTNVKNDNITTEYMLTNITAK